MKEDFSRRDFLKGSVASAMTLGAESVEARVLTDADKEKTERIREPIWNMLESAERLLSKIESRHTREYARVIRNVLHKTNTVEEREPGLRALANLFLDNPSDGDPTRALVNARAVVSELRRFLYTERENIRVQGLTAEAEDLRELLLDVTEQFESAAAGRPPQSRTLRKK